MIGFVRGKIDYLGKDFCLVDVNGIGFRVFMPAGELATLAIGQQVKLQTYLAVREDAMLLYGFKEKAAYTLFMQLIGVSGIGPKGALGILSGAKVDEIYLALQSRDLKFLTKLPGIGKKTAERMLLELKEKVGTLEGKPMEFTDSTGTLTGTSADEAMEALLALGYSNSEVIPVLQKIENREQMTAEAIIKQALKLMAGRK